MVEALKRLRKHRPDYQIVLFMGLLMLLGLVIMYAIGPQRAQVLNQAYQSDYSSTYFVIKQAVSLGLALAAFVIASLVPLSFVQKYASKLLLLGFLACGLLFVADIAGLGIAQETLGATRWFNLGGLGTLQPSEILKFGVLIYLAGFLGAKAKAGKINDVKETLIPAGIIIGLALLIIVVIQKDLGTGISLMAIVAAMIFVAGINARRGALIVAGVMVLGVLMIVSAPHRIARVATFFQGDNTSIDDASAYHIEHAKIAIGSGGFTGVGIGNSVQATGYLPEAINDSVFAIIGETFGFVGLIAVMALFGALLYRLLRAVDGLADMRYRLLAAGVFGWLAGHIILNIGAMIGIVPLTGITLPLLSFGGTSMVFIAAAIGLVFQLSKYTEYGQRRREDEHEDSRSRRGVGRPRYAGRRGIS